MLLTARYSYLDYNGQEASSGFGVADATTLASIDNFVIASEGPMSAISSALIASATASLRLPTNTPQVPLGFAPIARRLHILCRNGTSYAHFAIPSAALGLPVMLAGPYTGRMIDKTSASSAIGLIDQLVALLGATVRPDGSDWPMQEWQGYITE